MLRALAVAFSCAALPALAGQYVVRDQCPAYTVGRDRADSSVVVVRCTVGTTLYRLPGFCAPGPVDWWQRNGRLWLWCRGQPRPVDAR